MRTKLPTRRSSANLAITFKSAAGKDIKLLITVGYDEEHKIREVFCANFQSGSDNHALVMDACILLSRLLQHGDTPTELVKSMCSPPSLIGTIAQAILQEEGV